MSTSENLYEQIGGRERIAAIVDEFYDRVLDDETVVHFFDDMDMAAQRAHMTQFLSSVADGPVEYTGGEMRDVHEPLDLEREHFAAVATHLEGALRAFDVPDEKVEAVMAEVAALEDDVLCR
ncbi:group I truncated hemoglobin [Halomicrococcus sp. SG-WS-1]|uniref:group I truncated hemoglobin n=1 Tax=Halomicrococcus sp. SG-WS-1 TaxID=3439057 RepID=UPI003F7AA47F